MADYKNSEKYRRSQTRQDFLRTFLPKDLHYMEKEVNGFWLIKQYNGSTHQWEIAIYSQESYRKAKEWRDRHRGGIAESLF